MKKEQFNGRTIAGKFYFNDRRQVDLFFTNHPDNQWTITFETKSRKRSERQLAFYFSAFITAEIDVLKEQLGVTLSKTACHDFNKSQYFAMEQPNLITGEIYRVPRSSADFSPADFEFELEKIRQQFRQNFNSELPLPGELKH